jgi:hypothetical protein
MVRVGAVTATACTCQGLRLRASILLMEVSISSIDECRKGDVKQCLRIAGESSA